MYLKVMLEKIPSSCFGFVYLNILEITDAGSTGPGGKGKSILVGNITSEVGGILLVRREAKIVDHILCPKFAGSTRIPFVEQRSPKTVGKLFMVKLQVHGQITNGKICIVDSEVFKEDGHNDWYSIAHHVLSHCNFEFIATFSRVAPRKIYERNECFALCRITEKVLRQVQTNYKIIKK